MNKTSLSLIIALALIAATACSRRGTVIKKSVSYQGNKMRVEVYAKINGKTLHDFNKEFNVAGMDKAEREAIAQHIMDSIQIPADAGK